MVDIRTFGDGSDLQLIHGYGDGGSGLRNVTPEAFSSYTAGAWLEATQDLDKLQVDDLMPLIGGRRPFSCWEQVNRRATHFPILATPFGNGVSPLKCCRRPPHAGPGTC